MILEENEDHNNTAITKQYALELVVLGSQPCRITRHQFSPSSTKIWNGDVIEPYDRPMECHLEDAIEKGCYHPFTVSFGSKKQPLSTESAGGGGGVELEQEKTNSIDIEAETAATTAAAAFTEASRKIEAAAVQMDETKKKTIGKVVVVVAEEDPSRKENSQDTVDVQSVMLTTVETDVEMKAASESSDVGSVDFVKSADEKINEKKSSINDGGEKVEEMMTTTNAIICTSDSMSSKSDKKSVDNANAVTGMDCSSNHVKEEGDKEEGSVKATDVNLPPPETAMPSISTTENLKESPANTPNERESSSSSPSSEE